MEISKAQVRVPATMPEKIRWFTALLANQELSLSAKSVAGRIMLHHNERTGQCNPSHKRLALGLGLSEKHGRKHVCKLVGELKAGGWIEATETAGTCEYRLQLDRVATLAEGPADEGGVLDEGQGVPPVGDRGCPQSAAGRVPDQRQGVPPVGDTEPSIEPPREATKETTNPTPAPAAVAIEPGARDPATANAGMPDKPKANLPTPANDDELVEVGEVFHDLLVPADMMRQWLAAFPDTNVRGEVQVLAEWASGLPDNPKGRQLKAIQTRLSKIDAKARQERLSRTENRQAERVAGVERDFHGRIIPKRKVGWIENPLARPPGADRFWMPPNPGDEIVFSGKGWSLTKKKLDKAKERWPEFEIRARVTTFDDEQASSDMTEDQNRAKFAAWMDECQAKAKAA